MTRPRRTTAAHLGTLLATALASCAHEPPPPVRAPLEAPPAPPPAAAPAPSSPVALGVVEVPPQLAQSDPVSPPARHCPDLRSVATASATLKAMPGVVDLELTVSIPTTS